MTLTLTLIKNIWAFDLELDHLTFVDGHLTLKLLIWGFVRPCVFDALIFDKENSNKCPFLCRNAIECDLSDKPKVKVKWSNSNFPLFLLLSLTLLVPPTWSGCQHLVHKTSRNVKIPRSAWKSASHFWSPLFCPELIHRDADCCVYLRNGLCCQVKCFWEN